MFWSAILTLLSRCLQCADRALIESVLHKGTQIIVKTLCCSGHSCTWKSQPDAGQHALGNIRIVTGTILSGATFSRVSQICKFSKIACLGKTAFYALQKSLVMPAIQRRWDKERNQLVEEAAQRDGVHLAGDGRCDTPGHNAKYSSYSFLDQKTNKIIDFRITQVSETTSSNAMEKYGFVKVLDKLKSSGLKIKQITLY